MAFPKKILICPLSWGLGHATRCLSLIHFFLEKNCEVAVASDGEALSFLKNEFPSLLFFELPSYCVHYQSGNGFLALELFLQLPKFMSVIKNENKQIIEIAHSFKPDLILSDNRYGCYHSTIKSIFLGHQLTLPIPYFKNQINFFHQQLLKKFQEIWIPDFSTRTLSGILSETHLPHRFVGNLSAMKISETNQKIDYLFLLSGPEPQRTIFEKIIFDQIEKYKLKNYLVVRGTAENKVENQCIKNRLSSREVNAILMQAEIVICRSGYTTLLDLAKLKKEKIILIPTPQQPEQMYLAQKLMQENVAYSVAQANFDLSLAIQNTNLFTGFKNVGNQDLDLNFLSLNSC